VAPAAHERFHRRTLKGETVAGKPVRANKWRDPWAEAATMQARACLNEAIAHVNELSDRDRQRLAYLEQQSIDSQETTEDLFHTANNALFIISVNLELLTQYLASSDQSPSREVRRLLGVLKEKTREIAEINREVLSGDTSEDDGPLYRIHSFISFRSVIQRAIGNYEDVAREKSIRITWRLPDSAAIAIWSDGVALGVALDNLLSNAIKFSDPGTTIDVSLRREENALICAVRDQGPGLSEADRAHLFERGVQLGPRPTGGESSSGHGLAVARSVVESLAGRLWCESVEGEGSCFMISLPTAVPSQEIGEPAPSVASR
jgi:signal transduction histidine kinase